MYLYIWIVLGGIGGLFGKIMYQVKWSFLQTIFLGIVSGIGAGVLSIVVSENFWRRENFSMSCIMVSIGGLLSIYILKLAGWAVHDCWPTYFQFTDCKHAVCGAHLLRECNALIEQGSKWAGQFHAFLLDLYHQTDRGKSKLPQKKHHKILRRYQKLLRLAEHEEPPPQQRLRGKPKQAKGRNLLDRLTKHQNAVMAFAFHQQVPFTNNQAEMDIRPTKTKMKVSGCFRTQYGAEIYARVQSFVSTVRKQGFNPFNELFTVLSGGKPEYSSIIC